jgi:2-dehydro-3-deoxygluconokinase/2-dehydro-3-deoxygalactonokinase
MPEIITIGEPLVQFNAMTPGPLRYVGYFEKHVAGAEANVAVAAVRMGLTAGLISKVGDDEFGLDVLQTLSSRGVDVSQVKVEKNGFTGIYFVQRGYPIPGKSSVVYYRRGSAASHLAPSDVDPSYLRGAKLLHLTGITPALSDSCRETCIAAIKLARQLGLKVSFDTNIRLKLWSSSDARNAILPIIPYVNLLFTDNDDSRILMGSQGSSAAYALMSKGPEIVVLKGGAKGATAYTKSGPVEEPAFKVNVVDPTGAGDAFAGVFISGYLKGWKLQECLRAGNAAGSLVVTVRGDQENIPGEQDIRAFLEEYSQVETKK